MNTGNFGDGQFVNASILDNAFNEATANLETHGSSLHAPGITSPSSISLSYSGLVATANLAGSTFVFGSGVQASGIGNTAGQTSAVYATDFTPLVPSSGSVEAYLVAAASVVQQSPIQVVGPPVGHPDYDPTFAPYTLYTQNVDSVAVTATTTAPDNVVFVEIGRTQLNAGETSLGALDTSHRVYASAVLNPTGVAAGTYAYPSSLQIGADGRILSAANTIPQGLLLESQTFGPGSSQTFILPSNTRFLRFKKCVAGGAAGAGAAATNSSQNSCGGGGGSSGMWEGDIFGITSSTVFLNVGQAGTPAAGAAGGNGGTTTIGMFIGSLGFSVNIPGGNGFAPLGAIPNTVFATSPAGYPGASPTVTNLPPSNGSTSFPQAGGSGFFGVALGSYAVGGKGAACPNGSQGGQEGGESGTGVGTGASGPGAGGGGGANTASSAAIAGGSGGEGQVTIEAWS